MSSSSLWPPINHPAGAFTVKNGLLGAVKGLFTQNEQITRSCHTVARSERSLQEGSSANIRLLILRNYRDDAAEEFCSEGD